MNEDWLLVLIAMGVGLAVAFGVTFATVYMVFKVREVRARLARRRNR